MESTDHKALFKIGCCEIAYFSFGCYFIVIRNYERNINNIFHLEYAGREGKVQVMEKDNS